MFLTFWQGGGGMIWQNRWFLRTFDENTLVSKGKELIRFDWFMKFMLRDKVDFQILAGFLSELLKQDVEIITLLESESNQQFANEKFNRVDVLVRTIKDELIIIEIQNEFQIDFLQRLLFGTSKATVEYIKTGETYGTIKKVISVCIAYFDIGQGNDYIYVGETNFVGMHAHDTLQLTTEQRQRFHRERVADIFPTYYLIRAKRFPDIVGDKLDQWVYFFKNGEILEGFDAKGLALASQTLDYQLMSSEEKRAYDRYYLNLREENSWAWSRIAEIEDATMAKEREVQAAFVLELYGDGVPIAKIAQYTKLSEEEVRQILG